MNLQLTFTIAGQAPQTVRLYESRTVLGTLLSNHVVLRTAGVDPIHAMIEKDEKDNWIIVDLGSANGVKLNGQNIDVESPLKPGDQISIGSATLMVEETPATEAMIPPLSYLDDPEEDDVPKLKTKEVQDLGATAVAQYSSKNVEKQAPEAPAKDKTVQNTEQVPITQEPVQQQAPAHEATAQQPAQPVVNSQTVQKVEGAAAGDVEKRVEKKDLLFSPRKARPSGDVLEVVAYWDDTIEDVDLFHPTFKGFDRVTIGYSDKAHFLSTGEKDLEQFTFAKVGESGYRINLLNGMEARFRKGGKVEKVTKPGKYSLGKRDIAHVTYGALRYFFLFVKPPSIDLPRSNQRDPLVVMLSMVSFMLYTVLALGVLILDPPEKKTEEDDIWALIHMPTKEEKPVDLTPPPVEKPKEIKKIAEVKVEPEKKPPPPPKPKEVKPVKPAEPEKPKVQPKTPPPKPVTPAVESLTANKNQQQKQPQQPSKPPGQPSPKPSKRVGSGGEGMASTGAKNPDFRKPGPKTNMAGDRSGGAVGSGMGQTGGQRKGKGPVSVMGVEGANNNKASGVNLSKLGLGVGKILSQTGPGAVHTNFTSSAGGAGGGMGSGSKTYGLGGVGTSSSLGLAGSGSAVNNFGSGSGGFGSGQGGTGGLGGAGIGRGTGTGGGGGGRGRAEVTIPSSGPVVSGGLTQQEILAVIRSNLNQIRHCYEQLLQRSPNSSGKLAVDFVIGAQGRVTSISVNTGGSSINDSVMRGCVTGKIQRWNFPKPRGASSVSVAYPFVFTPL